MNPVDISHLCHLSISRPSSRVDFRRASGGVPEANDLDQTARIVEAVHNAIRTHNDLPNERVFKLRDDTPKSRGLREKPGTRNKKQTELKGAIRRVERDITDDVTQV